MLVNLPSFPMAAPSAVFQPGMPTENLQPYQEMHAASLEPIVDRRHNEASCVPCRWAAFLHFRLDRFMYSLLIPTSDLERRCKFDLKAKSYKNTRQCAIQVSNSVLFNSGCCGCCSFLALGSDHAAWSAYKNPTGACLGLLLQLTLYLFEVYERCTSTQQ